MLDLNDWNTSKVTQMDWMFENCSSLETLNLSGWVTSNVTEMDGMFEGCTKLNINVTANEGETGEYWATFFGIVPGYNYQAPEGTQVFKVNFTGTDLTMTPIADGIVNSSQGSS